MTTYRIDMPADADPHMRGPNVQTLLGSVGAALDNNAETVLFGRLQSIPYAGSPPALLADGRAIQCEPFVLPILAAQRGIRLWPTESVLSQRIRVSQWHQLRAAHGRHEGQLRNLQPWWEPGPLPWLRIFHQSNEGTPTSTCHTLDPAGVYSVHKSSPSNWNWDNTPSKSSRWWGDIHLPPGIGASWLWDDGTLWDGGALWGVTAAAAIADWVGMLLEAKGAGSRLAGLFVTTLQPTDDIPGHAGRHPFDPTDTAFTDAAGWTSLPTGSWGSATYTSGPFLGANTRFPFADLVYTDPA